MHYLIPVEDITDEFDEMEPKAYQVLNRITGRTSQKEFKERALELAILKAKEMGLGEVEVREILPW